MRTLHVLLVEDNPGDAELTRQALASSRLKIELSVVEDGEKALRRLRRLPPYERAALPDLMLLDLNLPKVSGEEVLREVKADPALKHLPVVVLTSSDAETEVARCYSAGANCYVVKPAEFNEFMSAVRAIEQFWFSVAEINGGAKDAAGREGRKEGSV